VVDKRIEEWVETCDCYPEMDSTDQLPEAIRKKVERARIIVLGEPNHFIHEKADYRLWWIDKLSRQYQLVLAEEFGRSDAQRVNQYLQSGDREVLDRIPTFGYKADERKDRVDTQQGILKASMENYPTESFKSEQIRFYEAVRSLDRSIQLSGFDINGNLGCGYVDVGARLKQMPNILDNDQVRQDLKLVPGESIREETERLHDVRRALEKGDGKDHQLVELIRDIKVMEESLHFADGTYTAPDYESLRPAMSRREELMKTQVKWLLDGLQADEKLVLMGHVLHLARHDIRLDKGVGPGGGITTSLGHHISQELNEQVFAVWMLYGSGQDSQPYPDLPNKVQYADDSINHSLLKWNRQLVLTTKGVGLLNKPVPFGHMYNAVEDIVLAEQADVLHFIPRVTPLQ
jgi:erythromycin esterase-like protein